MALYEFFPNYIWNLSVAIALENGGKIGEIVDMCKPIHDAAANGDDAGTGEFLVEWVRKADTLVELANEDLAAGTRVFGGQQAETCVHLLRDRRAHAGAGSPWTHGNLQESAERRLPTVPAMFATISNASKFPTATARSCRPT